MNKLSMYPMTREQCAIARYSTLLKDFTLGHCMIPSHLAVSEKDINVLDNGEVTNIMLSDYNREKLEQSDVLFLDCRDTQEKYGLHKDIVRDADSFGKKNFYI